MKKTSTEWCFSCSQSTDSWLHFSVHCRASRIAEFLLDGDLYGPVKKTISDLEEYDRCALDFCRGMASHYSKQLFEIYQNKEDPYFHP
jgi:hypothetical protein